ncbi:MAG: type VII toxin-antitoxin system HepT family RNase toxin [Thermodesulfobacteriota bacterium]
MAKERAPLNREVLQARISYIEDSLRSLERFKGMPYEEFHSNSDNFRICFYDLHRALEAVMDIGSHILSRIPGARPGSYKDIPRLLEKHKIIPADFASGSLTKMAGYRNRMVHFYGEITEKEIHDIVQEELGDFLTFITYIGAILSDPAKFKLSLE